jgi:hypothetical protein
MAIAQLFRKVYNTDIKKKQGTGTAAEECCGYGEAGLYRKSAGGAEIGGQTNGNL